MNTCFRFFLAGCLTYNGCAQGEILVANRIQAVELDAPVFDVDCATRLEGAANAAQAYVGWEPDSLAPVGPVLGFQTGAGAGYIQPRVVAFPPEMTRAELYFQLRAWEVAAGSSFEAASTSGGKHGVSNLLKVTPLPPPGGPEYLVGLQSFCLVPEPEAGTLLALGGAALLALAPRRRQRPCRRAR